MNELTSEELERVQHDIAYYIEPPDAFPEVTFPKGTALALIAMAKRAHQAERERDALRAAVAQLGQHSMSYRDYNGDDYVHCIVCEGRMELEGHRSNCRLQRLFALAEPTGAGGDA